MKNIVLSFLLLFLLTGCKSQPLTYHYIMQHPRLLQKEILRCQVEVVESVACKEVKRAAKDFELLLTERQMNPEQFGEKILRAQEQVAQSVPSDPAYKSQVENLQILMAVVAITGME